MPPPLRPRTSGSSRESCPAWAVAGAGWQGRRPEGIPLGFRGSRTPPGGDQRPIQEGQDLREGPLAVASEQVVEQRKAIVLAAARRRRRRRRGRCRRGLRRLRRGRRLRRRGRGRRGGSGRGAATARALAGAAQLVAAAALTPALARLL